MRFLDHVTLYDGENKPRITNDGYMVASVKAARTGIQEYLGSELGITDKQIVRVLRHEDDVFNPDSLSTFVGKPATDNHPPTSVNAENWKQYSVGSIGEGVMRDGEYIRIPLVMMDATAIRRVQNGKRELSMGYEMDLIDEQGEYNGQAYDMRMVNMRMNHIALVDRGRAGPQARIGDTWIDVPPIKTPTTPVSATQTTKDTSMSDKLRKVTVDGIPVETTDAGAQVIDTLQSKLALAEQANTDAQIAHDTALANKDEAHRQAISAKDTELARKDQEIDDLKKQVLSDADLDKRVAARSKLITKALTLLGKDAQPEQFEGKPDQEVMTHVVDKICGAGTCADKSMDYITARFDAIEVKTDQVRDTLLQTPTPQTQVMVTGDGNTQPMTPYAAMCMDLQNAHLNPPGQAPMPNGQPVYPQR